MGCGRERRGEGPRLYPWDLLFPGTLGGKREAFVTITLAFALSADGGPGAGLFPVPHTGIRLAASGSRSQCVRTSGASWHRARLRPPRLGVTCSPGPAPGPREGLRPEPGSGIGCLSSWCYLCLSFCEGRVLNPRRPFRPRLRPLGLEGAGEGTACASRGEGRVFMGKRILSTLFKKRNKGKKKKNQNPNQQQQQSKNPKPQAPLSESLSCLPAWAMHACWARK